MRLFFTLIVVSLFGFACSKPSPPEPGNPSLLPITVLLNLNNTNGAYPLGNLTLSGNVLYGMTSQGGATGGGVIFSIHTDGSGYKDMLNFTGPNGSTPMGSLTLSGNMLYGMTSFGGANGDGTIFSIDTNGSGYQDLFDFNGTNGASPYGSLTLLGNTLYGMTESGGSTYTNPYSHSYGCIFSIHINGSGYEDLFNFDSANGIDPLGSLTLSGNVLYGVTSGGAAHNVGCIFSIDTNGTRYKDLYDFNGLPGGYPCGALTLSGSLLYGMTYYGVQNLAYTGCIFSIDTNGSNYTDLYNFPSKKASAGNGSLTLSGNVLYGMANGGNGNGVIFSINTNGSNYTDLSYFGSNGVIPNGSLILSGNVLYGMVGVSMQGYSGDYGQIFSVKL